MKVHNEPDADIVQTAHGAALRGFVKVQQRAWPVGYQRTGSGGHGVDRGEAAQANRAHPYGSKLPTSKLYPHPMRRE